MPGLDRYPSMTGWNVVVTPVIKLYDRCQVLVARGRAQVGVAAAMADWPKRIRDMRYADHEDHGVAD